MSHTARDERDPASKILSCNTDGNMHYKPVNLAEFVTDPDRTEPLVGLQYVVEFKVLGTDESMVRCDLCHVKGNLKAMIRHLTGFFHIKTYMEVYYFTELKSIKYSEDKSKIPILMKAFAKEIERAEPPHNLQCEYMSKENMESEFESWLNENENITVFEYQEPKCQVLDRRKSALKFSGGFRITSRAEAAEVLKLTQQLSDRVEQYFRNCKGLGLDVLDSGVPEGNTPAFNNGSLPESSGSQSTSQIFEDPNRDPFISFQPVARKDEDLSQPMTVEEFPSQPISARPSVPFYSSATESNFAATPAQVFEPYEVKQEEQIPHVSPTFLKSKEHVEATYESKPPDVNDTIKIEAETDLSMENHDSDVEASTSQEDSSHESPSSGQVQGKMAKALSPDIIQLLKGKDASTVANILKTLSPFYPALQDVNLDILAQVLVNTGALA